MKTHHETSKVRNFSENSRDLVDYSKQAQHLKLKGQFVLLDDKQHLVYLCSPYVTNIDELEQYGMQLSAMPIYDATRDLVLSNQQRLKEVEIK